MQSITLPLERIFDVQRGRRHGNGPRRTTFGFESEGRRVFNVCVDGWPELPDRTTVTALLRKPGDWHSLVGWRDHDSGAIVRAQPAGSLSMVIAMLAITVCTAMFLLKGLWVFDTPSTTRLGLLGGLGFLTFVVLQASKHFVRSRNDLQALRALAGAPAPAPAPAPAQAPAPAGNRTGETTA